VNREQAVLVQQSFAQLVPIADEAAALFYTRLFDIDPSTKALFHGDMRQQGQKLMQTLGLAVRSLDRLDSLVPVVQALGRRHAGYGVTGQHFDSVGTALLWTLERGLGAAFTAEVRDAWASVYSLIATTMQAAMADTYPAPVI
jgi:hemoglobin-like flavoprotein